MNILTQMQYHAEQIVPGVNLDQLLKRPTGCNYSPRDRQQIAALSRSGNLYFTPSWLAAYYPVTEGAIVSIMKDPKIQTK